MLIDLPLGNGCYSPCSVGLTEATTIDGLNTSLTPKASHDQDEIIVRSSDGTDGVIPSFGIGQHQASEASQNAHGGF